MDDGRLNVFDKERTFLEQQILFCVLQLCVCLSVLSVLVYGLIRICVQVLRGDARVSYDMLYGSCVYIRTDSPPVLASGLSHARTDP